MNRPILKTISPGNTPITRSIDDFIFHITDQTRASVDPEKLDFLSKSVSTGMRDSSEKVFTLGGLSVGNIVDEKAISRRTASVVATPQEFLANVGYDFLGGRGKGVNTPIELLKERGKFEEGFSLLDENPSSLRVGEVKNFIGINAAKINEGKIFGPSMTAFHEFGHTATKVAGLQGSVHDLTYLNTVSHSGVPIVDDPNLLTNKYINDMVTRSLEESRAETYSFNKLFQSDKMLGIGKGESVFTAGYYSGFGTGDHGIEHPFHFTYGQRAMEDLKRNLKPGQTFDEMDTIIRGDIHANAAIVSTVGFGKGDESQLPRMQEHISNVRSNILEKHGEKYALEYDEALQQYGRLGRLGMSSDPKLISEATARSAAEQAARALPDEISFSIGGESSKISARIASKEMPKTIEEGISVAVRRGGTRELLAAGSHAAQAVAHNDSAAMRLAGAAATILRKRI